MGKPLELKQDLGYLNYLINCSNDLHGELGIEYTYSMYRHDDDNDRIDIYEAWHLRDYSSSCELMYKVSVRDATMFMGGVLQVLNDLKNKKIQEEEYFINQLYRDICKYRRII